MPDIAALSWVVKLEQEVHDAETRTASRIKDELVNEVGTSQADFARFASVATVRIELFVQ